MILSVNTRNTHTKNLYSLCDSDGKGAHKEKDVLSFCD